MRVASHAVLTAFAITIMLAQTGTLRPEVSSPEDPQLRAQPPEGTCDSQIGIQDGAGVPGPI
ncbi:MAG TPA: hypothetical protein VNH83_02435 [Bryobacteraceae bacterium]|nr:hypothetical protein [Bryobacteraceae bacterium]